MPSLPAASKIMKMKQLHRLSYCSIPCLVFFATLISNALASDVFFEDTIEDGAYLRREHCLKKPYHGENTYRYSPVISFYLACFSLLTVIHCRYMYV